MVATEHQPTAEPALPTASTEQYSDTQPPQQMWPGSTGTRGATTNPQDLRQTADSTSEVTRTAVGAQGKAPLPIGSILLPDQAFIYGSLGLEDLEAFSGTCKQAQDHVHTYLEQRCQQFRGTDRRRQLLEQVGLDCPVEKPAFAQMQAMVECTDTILKATKGILAALKVPIDLSKSPFLDCTAEQLVRQVPPEKLQGLLEMASHCNLYAAFASIVKLPPGLPLEEATKAAQAWLKSRPPA